ncbi:response regulator transcription factor [Erythrobacter sp. SD-21]|uniref:response regulator transcription factor n=1 Tax=Erythrobacter sp. SD-21 TaxID=161528 RepID=UPI000154088E|nr:response regulator transcription factor [Erythrobacter sp. SD-21]EDL47729.1 two component system response regulator [Erythrobacter sp. SD-21]
MTIESIVIADSDALSRIGLKSLLESSGCTESTTEIANFADLAGLLPMEEESVLVVDIHLAGLEGPDGISDLMRRHPGTKLCVLVDVATREVALEYLASGVMGCMAKSRSAEEIVEAVDVIADGRPYLCKLTIEQSADAPRTPPIGKLTRRQRKVMAVMAMGKSNKEIARELGICEGTVKVHVNAAYRALGVHNRVAAVRALQNIQQQRANDDAPGLPFSELVEPSGGYGRS